VLCFADQNGNIVRRSLGRVSPGYAKEQLGIFKRQVREGTYEGRKLRTGVAKEITCADLWRDYIADATNREKRVDRLVTAWTHLAPSFGDKRPSEVATRDLVAYATARRAAGRAAGTINRELATLKAAFRFAARSGIVARIAMFPKRLPEAQPRQGFIEQEQYGVLVANCKDLWLRTFLALGFNFAWRKGELLGLRVRNVDLLNGRLMIERSKNGEGRKVKLTHETAALLAECVVSKRPNDFVLTREDGSHVAQPRKDWYDLCARCGLGVLTETGKGRKKRQHYEGLQMHDLRRSGVRRLIRLGVPEKTAMAISGHKTRSVFDRYNITNERDLEEAAELLDAEFLGTTTSTKTDTSALAESPDSCNVLN
jgi:integrase